MSKKLLVRFEQLITEADSIQSMVNKGSETLNDEGIALFSEWIIKTKHLLILACGEKSVHLEWFIVETKPRMQDSRLKTIKRVQPILKAAYDDLKNGYITSFKQLVQAEVFDDELEQAKELLKSSYVSAAAVIAGVVLETTIRQLCNDNGINTVKIKLEIMNADLVKAGVYNVLQQKQITALAAIRNSAAHGKSDEYNANDVAYMISEVERFLTKYLS
ncbi:DUF4145 domain-containing protein [Aquirhabdus parva]|uniref:DUF4145 domain-containing protein n=1 Tax=Aquirhabdus parva TaxID=2283318 RepID=A0A345P5T5_9GAMM|nr:DUF4145 domain-containing protein [Aquirhabdus parva]AXI02644.1 DUF4145 domain-containing protein [Aquirhabdus parva]